VPKEKLPYTEIERGIAKLLEKIAENIENNNNISADITD
jgi:hypothetical protein